MLSQTTRVPTSTTSGRSTCGLSAESPALRHPDSAATAQPTRILTLVGRTTSSATPTPAPTASCAEALTMLRNAVAADPAFEVSPAVGSLLDALSTLLGMTGTVAPAPSPRSSGRPYPLRELRDERAWSQMSTYRRLVHVAQDEGTVLPEWSSFKTMLSRWEKGRPVSAHYQRLFTRLFDQNPVGQRDADRPRITDPEKIKRLWDSVAPASKPGRKIPGFGDGA